MLPLEGKLTLKQGVAQGLREIGTLFLGQLKRAVAGRQGLSLGLHGAPGLTDAVTRSPPPASKGMLDRARPIARLDFDGGLTLL